MLFNVNFAIVYIRYLALNWHVLSLATFHKHNITVAICVWT